MSLRPWNYEDSLDFEKLHHSAFDQSGNAAFNSWGACALWSVAHLLQTKFSTIIRTICLLCKTCRNRGWCPPNFWIQDLPTFFLWIILLTLATGLIYLGTGSVEQVWGQGCLKWFFYFFLCLCSVAWLDSRMVQRGWVWSWITQPEELHRDLWIRSWSLLD